MLKIQTSKVVKSNKRKTTMSIQKQQDRILLRSEPKELSAQDIQDMFKKYNFFDSFGNENGNFFHQYEVQNVNGDMIIIDHTTGLIWQQSGSKLLKYDKIQKWIDELNYNRFGGFKDWRLPTLEEAMSLMEREENEKYRYIDSCFDVEPNGTLTSDSVKGESQLKMWSVSYYSGHCSFGKVGIDNVRAVCTF